MQKKIDPKVKDILKLLGAGVFLSAAILMPGPAAMLLKEYQKLQLERDKKEWEKYNLSRLRQTLRRLQKQKVVTVEDGVMRITDKGRRKLLKFDIERMRLSEKRDGKWRLIIYDVANLRKPQRDLFRVMLKQLQCLRLQESVYLTPFVCEDEVEYLRQMFQIETEVIVLLVSKLENEEAFRKYFGI